MKKIITFVMLSIVIIVSYAIATSTNIDTNNMVEVKESHFQKHIEFWTVMIICAIGAIFYIYKRRD